MALFQVEPADTSGLFYVRTWANDGGPCRYAEIKFTDRKAAEAYMGEVAADRSYKRVEFVEVIEWIERSTTQLGAAP